MSVSVLRRELLEEEFRSDIFFFEKFNHEFLECEGLLLLLWPKHFDNGDEGHVQD